MWNLETLLEDARATGTVYAAFSGRKLVHLNTSELSGKPIKPIVHDGAIEGFLGRMYALVELREPTRVYRFWDGSEAQPFGAWWCPTRPGLAVDKLGYSSFHNQSRSDLAIKRMWNEMSRVAECTLNAKTQIYFGRAAAQKEEASTYHGGSIQYLLPPTERHKMSYTGDHGVG